VVTTAAGGPAQKSPPAATSPRVAAGIKLVAYTGAQPPGYTVQVIPAGWVIQGSNPFALVIAPANAASKDPDAWIGKLVVTQEAFDATGSGDAGWAPVPVAGHFAYYSAGIGGDPTAGLVIEEAPGLVAARPGTDVAGLSPCEGTGPPPHLPAPAGRGGPPRSERHAAAGPYTTGRVPEIGHQ
jgi:hypothetical protein